MTRPHTALTAPSPEAEWISITQAQALAKCSEPTVSAAIAAGEITQRRDLPRGVPSLQHESVKEWARGWRNVQDARAAAELHPRPSTGPPDTEHAWLATQTAALIIGVSPSWLVTLAAQDLAPHTRTGSRLWWRRDHVEVLAAARAARLRHHPEAGVSVRAPGFADRHTSGGSPRE